jgi:hypothetical protein
MNNSVKTKKYVTNIQGEMNVLNSLTDAARDDREDILGRLPKSKQFEKTRYSRHHHSVGLVVSILCEVRAVVWPTTRGLRLCQGVQCSC